MIQLIGYAAMACLACATLPQVYKTIKEGHSRGMAGGYIALLLSGFTLMSTYLLLTKPVWPVLLNYIINIIMMLTIGYYKLFPRAKNEKV
jgi:uncharacterized protein with PQ loop repeat